MLLRSELPLLFVCILALWVFAVLPVNITFTLHTCILPSHKKSLDKIESLHKRALRFLLNDYVSSYEQLLEKSDKCNMNARRSSFLCIEIYKPLND